MFAQRCLAVAGAAFVFVAGNPAGEVGAQDFLKDALGVLKKSVEEPSTSSTTSSVSNLAIGDIADGLREALRVGTDRAVSTVGRHDGYNADPDIHIPLPESLVRVQSALDMAGYGDLGRDLELRLNRAAEAAAPEALDVFWNAITAMTLDDAKAIYDGPDDAATRFFERTMTPDLTDRFRPIINDSLAQVGAIKAYDDMMTPYQAIPLVPDVKANLTDYAVGEALNGLFNKLAIEEAAIRQLPTARTTDILVRVFGG